MQVFRKSPFQKMTRKEDTCVFVSFRNGALRFFIEFRALLHYRLHFHFECAIMYGNACLNGYKCQPSSKHIQQEHKKKIGQTTLKH